MLVTVSASLSTSRWPIVVHGFAFALTSLLSIVLFGHGYFIFMLAAAFLLVHRRLAPDKFQHIQWQEDEVRLVTGTRNYKLSWTGHGRLSFAFIKLEIQGEAGKKALVIWKDQVSDASWRALNMAFSVWQPTILQRQRAAKALPGKTTL
jgi:hypothetical protein